MQKEKVVLSLKVLDGIRDFIEKSINGGIIEESELDLELRELWNPAGLPEPEQKIWIFICKVYGILATQFILYTVVSLVAVYNSAIHNYIIGNTNYGFLIFLGFLPFAILGPLTAYRRVRCLNVFVLILFSLSVSSVAGLICTSYEHGRTGLFFEILLSVVLFFLIGYSLLAHFLEMYFENRNFIRMFIGSCLIILVLTIIIQIFFPFGSIADAIIAGVSAIGYSGLILRASNDDLMHRLFRKNELVSGNLCMYVLILHWTK
ncbi:BI1-like protein [Quillaja saponaria]|uniref:BI1-like protein n=1 Tax=Quillaja saponaria TaxID=32244 RepID=A0AAD7LBE1_QUISA|nr:BI1-like protein [Quillaja saponaria]